MESYQSDVQALLRDINGGYGNLKHRQSPKSPLPPARTVSGSDNFHVEWSNVPRSALAPIHEQQPLYEAQASRPFDTCSYSAHKLNFRDRYGTIARYRDLNKSC